MLFINPLPVVFVAGGDLDGGNLGLESDGTAYYTPSTGKITATGFVGALTGAVTGNASTATALAGDPTDCGANTCATAIAASGNLTCSITPLVSGGTLTSGRVCRYDGTGIDCDRLEDASGACAASSVCMGGHTHAISSEVSGLAANVATFLATPSSANFASACTDEDGTGDCGAGLVCMGGHTHSSYAPINNATMTGTFAIANNIVISGNRHKWRIAIPDPNTVVTASAVIPIGLTDAAMTVTKVEAQTSSASYEVAGDVKYADARIGLANATVVNDFDTTSGVRSDSTITSAAIASGKFVYLSFDSAPNASMTDCVITVTWDYN